MDCPMSANDKLNTQSMLQVSNAVADRRHGQVETMRRRLEGAKPHGNVKRKKLARRERCGRDARLCQQEAGAGHRATPCPLGLCVLH